MISKETIIRRLAIAKYLYKLGLAQSHQPESMAFASILSFHDAVEIFLRLAAEKSNIKSDGFKFLEYWDKLSSLTLKESMKQLNDRRVNLKHRGILPAKQDLEISRVNVTDFFEQNTTKQFDIEFSEISLISLISYSSVRNYLDLAQKDIDDQKFQASIENSGYAFYELLETYEQNKTDEYVPSPFHFGTKMRMWPNSQQKLRDLDRGLADCIENMQKSLESLQECFKIMSLGIDYRKFSMFKLLSPVVTKTREGVYFAEVWGEKKWTQQNCQFCIDFIIETALKFQEFDFDITSIINNEPFTLEFHDINLDTEGFFRDSAKS